VAHFKKYGVDKKPIAEKYHSAAAAMYREVILALREGRAPPSDIAPFEEEVEADRVRAAERAAGSGRGGGGGGGSGGGGGGGGGGSSGGAKSSVSGPSIADMERERDEARARLREKFGAGGLKGESVGYTPPGWSPPGAGGGAGVDDLLGVDIAASCVLLPHPPLFSNRCRVCARAYSSLTTPTPQTLPRRAAPKRWPPLPPPPSAASRKSPPPRQRWA
jgi:hypothetical protein